MATTKLNNSIIIIINTINMFSINNKMDNSNTTDTMDNNNANKNSNTNMHISIQFVT